MYMYLLDFLIGSLVDIPGSTYLHRVYQLRYVHFEPSHLSVAPVAIEMVDPHVGCVHHYHWEEPFVQRLIVRL